ncbi:MAG: hypothetical protein M1438_07030 [Deltaproteobacteria bacterium]|nr:hypothetical protein [Deltaproteobacteria bacterium]
MNNDLLTPAEAMAALRIKDRHTLNRLVAAGKIERFNKSAGRKQARWLYRLVELPPAEPPPATRDLAELTEQLLLDDLNRRLEKN